MQSRSRVGPGRHAREPQHRHDVRVVPLERDGKRDDVEVARQGLRFQPNQRRSGRQLLFQLLFGRQEQTLAHDFVLRVEELIDGLEAEIRHPDEIGIGKGQRDAKPPGVRLAHVAHFLRERGSRLFNELPGFHQC